MKYFLCLFIIFNTFSYDFKIRAREHYEILDISYQNADYKYRGLTNTINLWWEKPYEEYFGFSVSPIIASLKAKDTSDQVFGEEIDHINVGLEYKKFPKLYIDHAYFRVGLAYSVLKPENNIKDFSGYSMYGGLGYEYPFKNFGLALELAYRYSNLSDDLEVLTFTPSIGFHFYEMF